MKRFYLGDLRPALARSQHPIGCRSAGEKLQTGAQCPERTAAKRGRRGGFTLVEMMVASTLFIMLVAAVIYSQIFGLKYDEICNSKMGASEEARVGFDQLMNDIRGAKVWRIGSGGLSNSSVSFTAVGNAAMQVGNALQLFPSPSTNSPYILYYFDTNTACLTNAQGRLCRVSSLTNNLESGWSVLVQYLTNTMPATMTNSMFFHAEDYQGNVVNDYQYKFVIVTTMEFAEYQYPTTFVGSNCYFNYYRMRLKATSHCPN